MLIVNCYWVVLTFSYSKQLLILWNVSIDLSKVNSDYAWLIASYITKRPVADIIHTLQINYIIIIKVT